MTTTKKTYYAIETALQETPREAWPTSARVSRSLLTCVRLRGIVREHILKRGVSLEQLEDIISEIAMVMQMKMVAKLQKVEDVYFVAYRVSQLVVSNYGKKSINTLYAKEISLSSILDEDDDEADAMERLSTDNEINNHSEVAERQIDMDNAKRRFKEKLSAVGWPEDIKRERTRLGRPPKQNPLAINAEAS